MEGSEGLLSPRATHADDAGETRMRAMAVAREVQKEVRSKDPALDQRPRSSRDDPDFVRCARTFRPIPSPRCTDFAWCEHR